MVDDMEVTDTYCLYRGDCIEVMAGLPKASVHLSVYSPPFGGLYNYSSDVRDLSNAPDYDGFLWPLPLRGRAAGGHHDAGPYDGGSLHGHPERQQRDGPPDRLSR